MNQGGAKFAVCKIDGEYYCSSNSFHNNTHCEDFAQTPSQSSGKRTILYEIGEK